MSKLGLCDLLYESIQLTSDQYLPDKLAKFGIFLANLGIRVFEQFSVLLVAVLSAEGHDASGGFQASEQQPDDPPLQPLLA